MATSRISQARPPDVDPIKATLAFGDRAIPRLERELKSTQLLEVQRALMALCDLLRSPSSLKTALDQGIIGCLVDLLRHTDGVVRQKATEALLHFSGHATGRDAIVAGKLFVKLAELFGDSIAVVRSNVQSVIERTSTTRAGAEQLVELGLVPVLLDAVKPEVEPEILDLILETLYHTMKVDTDTLLGIDAMKLFVDHLKDPYDPETRKRAATNIMALSFPLEGKEKACADGAVPALVALLDCSDPARNGLVAAAAGALMSITVTTQGKTLAIEHDALVALPQMLGTGDERVLLNGIKLITTLAEHPVGRRKLQALVPTLTEMKNYAGNRLDVMAIARNVQTAIDTIVWRP